MEHWVKCYEKCPLCGGVETEYNIMEVLTSCPPQYSFKCKCGHHWSGTFDNDLTTTPVYKPQKKINGSYGWICPVCGAGVSPYQDHCPCCSGKSLTPTWTCGSGCDGLASKGIPCVTHVTALGPDSGTLEIYTTSETEEKYNGNKSNL